MTSTQLASVMIFVSGAAHAIVNAVLKAGNDKLSSRALIDGFSALIVLPVAFVVPLPHGAWGWLATSALVHLVYRGPRFLIAARTQWRAGLFAGAMSIVSYGLALWAYRLGDTPRLAALRETSILFAALLAIFVLKERVTAARLAGIGLIAAGAALLLAMD